MPQQPPRRTTQMTPPPSAVLDRVKKDRPVGGVPPVKIPPLDAAPLERGGSMASQARTLADPASPLSPSYDPSAALPPPRQFRVRPPSADKPAQEDGTYRPQLSPETVEGLRAIEEARREQEEVQRQAAEAERQAVPDPAKSGDEAIEELRTLFADDSQWSLLNNPARKKAIEARLAPLDIMDLVVHGELHQEVPIVPGKLTVLLRSVTGAEDLAVKQLMSTESGSDRYLTDKFSLMGLTLGLVAINGAMLPAHTENGEFKKELFEQKFKVVLRYPMTMLAEIGLQFFWFDKRVQALLADEVTALKNS